MATTIKLKTPVPKIVVANAVELINKYLFGIAMISDDGKGVPDSVLQDYIDTAVSEFETFYSVKILRQEIFDTADYERDHFRQFNLVRTQFPVVQPIGLAGTLNQSLTAEEILDVSIIDGLVYPREWLSSKKGGNRAWKQINIVPNSGGGSVKYNSQVLLDSAGNIFFIGMLSNSYIPNYWRMRYVTGWSYNEFPSIGLDFILKLAAVNALSLAGELQYAVGMASNSISIDGLSQSFSTTSSATSSTFGAREQRILEQLKEMLPRINSYFKGITIM